MIERIAILSLIAIGICCTTWEGMIFDKPARAIELYIGEWWSKPLFGCYICATVWYGGIMCWIAGWPLWYALPAMGLSATISLFQHD
jgi:hypothetical protein